VINLVTRKAHLVGPHKKQTPISPEFWHSRRRHCRTSPAPAPVFLPIYLSRIFLLAKIMIDSNSSKSSSEMRHEAAASHTYLGVEPLSGRSARTHDAQRWEWLPHGISYSEVQWLTVGGLEAALRIIGPTGRRKPRDLDAEWSL